MTAPVRGATLIGNGPEALAAIDGIAGDLDDRHRLLRQGRPARARRRRPAARADQGAHGRGHRVTPGAGCRPRRSRPPRRPARPTPRRGPRSARASRCASTRRRSSRSPTRAGAGSGCACSWTAARATRTGPTCPRRACARSRRRAHAGAAAADTDEHGGLPDEFGDDARSTGSTRPRSRTGAPSARSSSRPPVDRAARAREGVTQVEQTVYADSRGRVGDREQPRLRRPRTRPARPRRTRRRSPARAPT